MLCPPEWNLSKLPYGCSPCLAVQAGPGAWSWAQTLSTSESGHPRGGHSLSPDIYALKQMEFPLVFIHGHWSLAVTEAAFVQV